MSINALPAELIRRICELVNRRDLPAISRVSRRFNALSNSLIYTSITLTNSDKAFACCKTLATSPRDLAGCVRTFSVDDFPPWNFTDWHRRQFREWLVTSIRRMSNLLHFKCFLVGSFAQDMSIALSGHTSLRSLAVSLPHFDPWSDHYRPPWPESALKPLFPELESFAFTYSVPQGPICAMYLGFILHILRAHAGHLRCLHLPDWLSFDTILQVLPPDINLTALTSLTILSSALNPAVTERMPAVRSLTFPKYEPDSSHADVLNTERPLRYVHFDGAVFDMADTDIFTQGDPPQWSEVLAALKRFPRSTGPVRHLRFYICFLHISFLTKARPYITSLETLTICIRNNIKDLQKLKTLGRKLLKEMPKLHTLLLSDEPYYAFRGKRFTYAFDELSQKIVLTQWEKECPTLTSVSFTAAFVWNRIGGGWVKGPGPRGIKEHLQLS
ncbi:unnamed protein product [Somion occarium]|uniref:F-box domain-containing protein n=1 Tax=Somion occarium TaxID=3059160 RepID=A0ABP1EBT3_9APHY